MPEQEGQEQKPGSGEVTEGEKGQVEGQPEGQKPAEAEAESPYRFDYKGQTIEPNADQHAHLLRTGMAAIEAQSEARTQKEQEEPAKPAEQEAEPEAGTLGAMEQRLAKAEQTAKDANARSEKLEGLRERDLIGTQVQRALDQQVVKYDLTRDNERMQARIQKDVLLAIRMDGNKSVGTAYKEAVAELTELEPLDIGYHVFEFFLLFTQCRCYFVDFTKLGESYST